MEANLNNKSKEELIAIINSLAKEKSALTEKIKEVEFNLKKLQNLIFRKKSERQPIQEDKESRLFDEAELYQDSKEETLPPGILPGTDLSSVEQEETVQVNTYTRKRPGRTKISDAIPRVDHYIDLEDHAKICACGATMTQFGEEISEKLDIVPMKILVNRTIRPKYVCKSCNGNHPEVTSEVRVAKLPNQLIPKSLADIGLIVHALIAKFCDGTPFYRLSNIFLRYGLEISRTTLCNYTIQSYEKLKYLDFEFWKEIKKSPYIQIDETPVKVNKVEGKKKDSKSYMFVIRTLIRGRPVIRYFYNPSRSANFLSEHLKDYEGIIQTDGWTSYDFVFKQISSIQHAGCWVHARREFMNILQVNKNHKGSQEFVRLIGELYRIEKTILFVSSEDRLRVRKTQSREVTYQIRSYLDSELLTNFNNTPYGRALKYLHKQWDKLMLFLEHPDLPLDTNLVENAIRPFVIGRKNWLFSDTDRGAEASAFFYSLIETAKANRLEPYAFLRQFMTVVQEGGNPKYFGWVP